MRATLDRAFRSRAEEALREEGLDGWLLYGLEERNPVVQDVLGVAADPPSRRYFLLLRPGRDPTVLCHRIERQPFAEWPGELRDYVGWREMEEELDDILGGCRRVAMEVSERDAVPFVDHVPAGVRDLVASLGPEVVGSSELIARSCARWGGEGRRCHGRSSRVLSEVAREAFVRCVRSLSAGAGAGLAESELAGWVRGELRERGQEEVDTIVAFGPNAANPHYSPPAEGSRRASAGEAFLVDLWGREADEPRAVFADQTWMGVLGPAPEAPSGFREAWEAVRDARDACVEFIAESWDRGEPPAGADADRAARRVLEERGFAEAILHRTGHGIDRALHGFGPNLDSVETRDRRRLVEGVGFSVEPGVYLEGEFGIRSEINVHMGPDGPEVTTPDVQDEPWSAEDVGGGAA